MSNSSGGGPGNLYFKQVLKGTLLEASAFEKLQFFKIFYFTDKETEARRGKAGPKQSWPY
jgi:hypothetical protein